MDFCTKCGRFVVLRSSSLVKLIEHASGNQFTSRAARGHCQVVKKKKKLPKQTKSNYRNARLRFRKPFSRSNFVNSCVKVCTYCHFGTRVATPEDADTAEQKGYELFFFFLSSNINFAFDSFCADF